jgi:hypothetical protein
LIKTKKGTTMSEQLENAPTINENEGNGRIDAARAIKKGAIVLGGLDKQSPEYLDTLSPLTPTGQAEFAALETVEQKADTQEGIQDPLSHLSAEQKTAYSNEVYALNDASVRGQWDEERVDAVRANINAKYSIK